MKCSFMPGRSTIDVIFILGKKKNMYFAFVDLKKKAFDRVPWKVLWWAMCKLGIDECIIRSVQAMYCNAQSKV